MATTGEEYLVSQMAAKKAMKADQCRRNRVDATCPIRPWRRLAISCLGPFEKAIC